MKLVEAFNKYNCDKGSLKHRYDRVYEPAIAALREQEFDLLEIGIFKGNSIEAILEYAPLANVVGVDTFQRVDPENISILQHKRVQWLKGSSLDQPDSNFEALVPKDGFDIIIDDGLHTHEAQRITFENFFPYLKDNGVYFIEDVWPFDIMSQNEKQHNWLKKHPNEWNDVEYEKLLNTISQYSVKYHDLRKGFDPDTFIIEVRK